MFISEIKNYSPEEFSSETKRAIFGKLDALGIPFSRVDTGDGTTMEACIPIGEALGAPVVKTVFLTNRQQNKFWLYVTSGDKPFVTRDFCGALGIPRVSFAPEELLLSVLGTPHGATTVLSLNSPKAGNAQVDATTAAVVLDKDGKVQLVMDKAIADSESFSCTDGTPFGFIRLETRDLSGRFLPSTGHEAIII